MRTVVLVLSLFFFACPSAEEAYKSVDAEGNVSYSDEPSPGAEQIDVPEAVTPEAPAPPTLKQIAPKPTNNFAGYREVELVIASGEDPNSAWEETGSLPISVRLVPTLQAQLGHTLELFVDGKVNSPPGTTTSFEVPMADLDPGEHSFQAVVLNSEGYEVGKSEIATLYVHHHTRHR
ncbi:MAG: DUF4124 domain-containing protein [Gammaproteobacteria bacterium]|nr:DUF4124 domain-containing protein [Gammaproteobacteria bacterium]MCI0590232.1 DUF4124 domain-containing protein [Gammaproteobacteria bacterium]